MNYSIYAVVDPRDNKFLYVGASSQPHVRYLNHCLCNQCGSNSYRYKAIQELTSVGLKPILLILQNNLPLSKVRERECFYIKAAIEEGHPLEQMVKSNYKMDRNFKHPDYKGKNIRISDECHAKILSVLPKGQTLSNWVEQAISEKIDRELSEKRVVKKNEITNRTVNKG